MKTSIRRLLSAGASFLLSFSLLALIGCSPAEKAPPGVSFFDFAADQKIHTLLLETELDSIYAKVDGWQDASLEATLADGRQVSFPVSLQVRGNNRQEVCSFPPLKLKVKQMEVGGQTLLSGKYKLVTHCLDTESGEPLLFKEYLAYQLYSQLTEVSFRTHLLKVHYVDQSGDTPPVSSWMILLESNDELADRLNATYLEEGTSVPVVQADRYNLFSVFQYMIGNTDWNMSKQHNVKMLQLADERFPSPVPYDFDLSGLVSAPYASPHPMIPIDSVQERFFQWRGKDPGELKPTVEFLKARKARMLDVCATLSHLEEVERQEVIQYLETFFERIDILWSHSTEMVNSPRNRKHAEAIG